MKTRRFGDFWSKVVRSSTGCLLWTAGTYFEDPTWGKPKGLPSYGAAWYNGRTRPAHRVAWEKTHGPIPEGKLVLHRCGTKLCVNPEHLYLGTAKDNVADAIRMGERPKKKPNKRHMNDWQTRVAKRLYKKVPATWLAGVYGVPVYSLYDARKTGFFV